jgi:hypothetical protein
LYDMKSRPSGRLFLLAGTLAAPCPKPCVHVPVSRAAPRRVDTSDRRCRARSSRSSGKPRVRERPTTRSRAWSGPWSCSNAVTRRVRPRRRTRRRIWLRDRRPCARCSGWPTISSSDSRRP